jgi:hypothetical protein
VASSNAAKAATDGSSSSARYASSISSANPSHRDVPLAHPAGANNNTPATTQRRIARKVVA